MSEPLSYYGHQENVTYPLTARVWGHRLREGQHWMEYLLEFLNVLMGFDYVLGQGIDGVQEQENYLKRYKCFSRMGLRRFVFYDEREKTKDSTDDYAQKRLLAQLEHVIGNGSDQEKAVACVRDLFRSLSAVEENRAWYAKSLLPINHSLLFWEGRKNSKVNRPHPAPDIPLPLYDADISFSARNFFARGGEIYYLILSAGTEEVNASLSYREIITRRLKSLLTDNNQDLGFMADYIDRAWYGDDNINTKRKESYPLGWIPDPSCSLYKIIAEDTATFLQKDLDISECMTLLASLISFHLALYIYHRAQPDTLSEPHSATCYRSCRPLLLVHMVEGEKGKPIREFSGYLFRQQEVYQEQKAKSFLEAQVSACAAKLAQDDGFALRLVSETMDFFSLDKKGNARISQLKTQCSRNEISTDIFLKEYKEELWKIAEDDFRKNFLGVHRKLTKAAGFVAPRKGSSGRFVLSDDLLKTLVLANVSDAPMPFDNFLARLYDRYGIIIGQEEAYQSGIVAIEPINTDYYELNRLALLEKMKRARLVAQYSDATALVIGRR